MGMDYQFSGSASYPRFDDEVCKIIEILGGMKTDHLKEREKSVNGKFVEIMFGFMSGDISNEDKFIFPDGTNEVIIKWANHIYDYLTPEETKSVFEIISTHPEIKEVSNQIWHELEMLVKFGCGWNIC